MSQLNTLTAKVCLAFLSFAFLVFYLFLSISVEIKNMVKIFTSTVDFLNTILQKSQFGENVALLIDLF